MQQQFFDQDGQEYTVEEAQKHLGRIYGELIHVDPARIAVRIRSMIELEETDLELVSFTVRVDGMKLTRHQSNIFVDMMQKFGKHLEEMAEA